MIDMKTHTPGPWSIDTDRSILAHPRNPGQGDGGAIAEIYSWMGPDEADANAALIAAAPALLEVARIEQALHMGGYTKATAKRLGPEAEEAYLILGVPGLNDWRRRKREAAIAEAEGRS